MNGVKIRSSQGCWTCRLRRKKCDETKPVCVTCAGLEIDCLYSDTKPEWMDGGVREKQMADDLKVTVKQKANERRERKWAYLPTLEDLSPSSQQIQRQPAEDISMGQDGDPAPSDDGIGDESSSGTMMSSLSLTQAETNPSSESSPHMSTCSASVDAPVEFSEDKSEMEVTYTMVYLDYVVPYLFPFYRPCMIESSRGWMLVLLMKNRALFHTALSLANWLYAVILDSMDGSHGDCKRANWNQLQERQGIAIKALQEDIKALNARGVANAFKQSVSCMQSIIQLLEFEVAMGNTENWQVHHDAAVVLFDQLMTHHATDNSTTPWTSILGRIGLPFRRIPLGNGRQVLTSDQTAYRFYTAYLLWIDIVAATANGETPRLQQYHAELLHGDEPIIRLGEYVGCHNWAMLKIAEVAQLAAWKREQQATGSLSMVDLVHRACGIQSAIRQKMGATEPFPTDRATPIFDPSAQPVHVPYSGLNEMVADAESQATPAMALHTHIWAQATITYLNVLVSGLQPELREIQTSVQATIELFRMMPSPLTLRTLIWPFAVTGCLALPEQQPFFIELVNKMGAMQIFGTIKEALNIMQDVWKHRESCCVSPQMWDIATCLSVLGRRSLLV
ncbi:fungal-specific transcription factor domain-containing protein [Xylariaceae sp. FL1651]|nr:fungal-specific transcription factor domain-containing protein [Xylariaceae sp. FL1651]